MELILTSIRITRQKISNFFVFLDSSTMNAMDVTETSEQKAKSFNTGKEEKSKDRGIETRKILVPKHRMAPLKENWLKIFNPVVEHLKLQIRFNLKTKKVEIRTSKDTQDISNLQKGRFVFK